MNPERHGRVENAEMRYESDRPKAENPVLIQDDTFRDGHQSIFATRGRTEDLLIMAEEMDKVGFYSMEVWGGATFDTMHRFLNEDPWERLRTLKKHIVRTPLAMLLRGQNLVGYRNYADDVVEAFVDRSCANGIDIFRVFDALNDFRNFQTAVKVIKSNGKHFQGTICYSLTEQRMGGEVYNIEYYLEKTKQLEDMGADSICVKDMAGLIAPYDAYTLVSALKDATDLPINLHTHFTSGMGDLATQKAIEAGVDIVDTCMSPFAYRTSHAALEPLVVSLLGTNRDTGLDVAQLIEISKRIEAIAPKYRRFLNTSRLSIIDTNVLLHQTPGGMISNLVSQLKQMGELDRLDDVFAELPRVRRELGQLPLVTPTSQIVGIQTVNNVLFDTEEERYTKITNEVKDLCFGLYGQTPRPIDKDVLAKALQGYPRGDKPITSRPADILEPELDGVRERTRDLAKDMDDLLICALFPVTGERFLRWKYNVDQPPEDVAPTTLEDIEREDELIEKALAGELVEKPRKEVPAEKPADSRVFDVYVDGEYYKVEVGEQGMPAAARVPGAAAARQPAPQRPPAQAFSERAATSDPTAGDEATSQDGTAVHAAMPGMIVSYEKQVGDSVVAGDTVVVVEAMKMNNPVEAPHDGVVTKICFKSGDSVKKGETLLTVRKN